MFVKVLLALGMTPNHGKSGKREASWAVFFVVLLITLWCIWLGVAMVQAMQGLLIAMWAGAFGLVAAAYKLEHDKGAWRKAIENAERPDHYPEDIAPPGEPYDPDNDSRREE